MRVGRLLDGVQSGEFASNIYPTVFNLTETSWLDFCKSEIDGDVDVYHLAANSDISLGQVNAGVDKGDTFETTFSATRLSDFVSVNTFYFASSSAIYGDTGTQAVKEDHGPLLPISNYGAMKLASEAILASHHSKFRALKILRFPNVIGPMLTHGVIYDFIEKMTSNPRTLQVLGDGTQTKPYLHVEDLINAIEIIGKVSNPTSSVDIYNICGQSRSTVRFIAESVATQFDCKDLQYQSRREGWHGDVPEFSYNTEKIDSLGWKEHMSSDDAVLAAIESNLR